MPPTTRNVKGACPECGREYILRRTLTFSTGRPAQEQFVHEQDETTEIGFFTDYCMGEVVRE